MSEPTNGQRETCLACRQSKVKCDRSMPACGRCVRLGIACMDSAPSRRGRSRTVGKKTAALQQLSGSALDSVARGPDHITRDIQDTATRGGTVSIEHIREWLLVALARDSSTLFARAALMASQGGIQLSDVFAVPTMSGACCAVRSECCGFYERLPPGNPFARRFAAQARVTPQLSPQASPVLPADGLEPPAAKRARPGAISAPPAATPLIHLADACDCACDAGDKTSDTRRDDAASKASEALANAFPAHLPRAARALLRGPYNEAYAWFRVCVDGAIRFGATAVFEEKVRSRTEMASALDCRLTLGHPRRSKWTACQRLPLRRPSARRQAARCRRTTSRRCCSRRVAARAGPGCAASLSCPAFAAFYLVPKIVAVSVAFERWN